MRHLMMAALLAAGCAGHTNDDELRSSLSRITSPNVPAGDLAALVAGNTTFATELHRVLAAKGGNVVYSPYDISIALAMLAAGATADNQASIAAALDFTLPEAQLDPAFDALDLTLTQIEGATESGSGQQLKIGNAIWSAMGVTQAYLDTLQQYYGAGILTGKDPTAAIAGWQAQQTDLPALPFALAGPCDFAVVSLDAFDAAWQTPFDPSATQPAAFHRVDGTDASVPFMNMQASLSVSLGADRAIELPYDGGALSLLVVVPADLATFEAGMSTASLAQLVADLAPAEVQLSMPKVKLQTSTSILDTLAQLGLTLNTGGVWEIWHSALVDISEKGTQAEAMTVASHAPASVITSTPFSVDRPFLFFIRHPATGTVVFAGRVVDPSAS